MPDASEQIVDEMDAYIELHTRRRVAISLNRSIAPKSALQREVGQQIPALEARGHEGDAEATNPIAILIEGRDRVREKRIGLSDLVRLIPI